MFTQKLKPACCLNKLILEETKLHPQKSGARGVRVIVVGNGHEFKSWT